MPTNRYFTKKFIKVQKNGTLAKMIGNGHCLPLDRGENSFSGQLPASGKVWKALNSLPYGWRGQKYLSLAAQLSGLGTQTK